MSLKSDRQRAKLRKKAKQGFRGHPLATMAHYWPTDKQASKVVVAVPIPAFEATERQSSGAGCQAEHSVVLWIMGKVGQSQSTLR